MRNSRRGVEREMEQFVSTFTNKIDAKGRISVPVSFRTVLAKDGFEGIYYDVHSLSAVIASGRTERR